MAAPGRMQPHIPARWHDHLRLACVQFREYFCWSLRRVWDLNPRGHSRALAVFKTAAIGH